MKNISIRTSRGIFFSLFLFLSTTNCFAGRIYIVNNTGKNVDLKVIENWCPTGYWRTGTGCTIGTATGEIGHQEKSNATDITISATGNDQGRGYYDTGKALVWYTVQVPAEKPYSLKLLSSAILYKEITTKLDQDWYMTVEND